ncbi:hypothetical protein RJ639_012950 [Escallonia herrerae]|uniref:Transcription initiation factor TFIID subunit 8 n=1 Tax=Escallonia herrerae TaxID=1293975 RepID=A0AA88VNU9_9ASTE|nr:hypothetical protein RJ639_012950 [Escallonia herrerae]
MSDGGGEFESSQARKKSRNNEFVQAIARIAVAQVCEGMGFQGFQQSALGTLSDVAVRYIREIGKVLNSTANLAGRTECNVIHGLEELGGSESNLCLVESGPVREIDQYINMAEEIPFACTIPHFPVIKDWKVKPSFVQVGEKPPGEHIPAWLPAFPDPKTYNPVQDADVGMDKVELVKDHRKGERSLSDMQRQLDCKGYDAPMVKSKRVADINPFLAVPLRFGEKEVSPVILPTKLLDENVVQNPTARASHVVDDVTNHVSALETFAPAIEAIKSRESENEEDRKKFHVNSRSTVQFKFGIGKKFLGIQNEGVAKPTSWFGNDSARDERKRRAEKILKESMENPKELVQL